MRRREFVYRLPVVASGLLAGVATLPLAACGGVRYVVPRTSAGRLVIASAEVSPGGDVFVQGAGMERPVYVRRDASGEVVALLARCTHRGCQPEAVAGRLVCPCHGSEFSLLGEVLQGPAERPLTRYRVSEEGGEIVVYVGEGSDARSMGEPARWMDGTSRW